MGYKTVQKTKELDLCISCEICSAICPKNAISMEFDEGQFLPVVDENLCILCEMCIEVCPGINLDPLNKREKEFSGNLLLGNSIESFIVYSKDIEIRNNSTSGGVITTLILALIEQKIFDEAFVLNFDFFQNKSPRLQKSSNRDFILSASKSKYIPSSLYTVIKEISKKDNKKYIIVGAPCQFIGLNEVIKRKNLNRDNFLFIGFFCDKNMNLNVLNYFENRYREKDTEFIDKLEFRTKEKTGWPGDIKISFNSGRISHINKIKRMELKKYFQLNRCLFCIDKLNPYADIACGDCYIKGKSDKLGKSSIIIRSIKGKEIFNRLNHLFILEKSNLINIGNSQVITQKKENFNNMKQIAMKIQLNEINEVRDLKKVLSSKIYNDQRKKIKLGKKRKYSSIEKSLKSQKRKKKLDNTFNKIRKLYRYYIASVWLFYEIIKNNIYNTHRKEQRSFRNTNSKRNILILGGDIYNKGAQAMTFTVVNQIRKRKPNKKVYLLTSKFYEKNIDERNLFTFDFLYWTSKVALSLYGGEILKTLNVFSTDNQIDSSVTNLRRILENTDCFIDISGYSLSSEFGKTISFFYIFNIMLAKKFNIDYFIFPQSIGPFNYNILEKILLFPLMKLFLKYPKIFFIRERNGIKWAKLFTKKNINFSVDTVLQNSEYKYENIYRNEINIKKINVLSDSVAIIPNKRVIKYIKEENLLKLYKDLIKFLLREGKHIYILRHSVEDLDLCKLIKELFPENNKVELLYDDLTAIELETIIKQLDFIVGSRYHSIIHAYKNGIPAIILGWAVKYRELASYFKQSEYVFDFRKKIDIENIFNKIELLKTRDERKIISEIENKILSDCNIFDQVFS